MQMKIQICYIHIVWPETFDLLNQIIYTKRELMRYASLTSISLSCGTIVHVRMSIHTETGGILFSRTLNEYISLFTKIT